MPRVVFGSLTCSYQLQQRFRAVASAGQSGCRSQLQNQHSPFGLTVRPPRLAPRDPPEFLSGSRASRFARASAGLTSGPPIAENARPHDATCPAQHRADLP